MKADDLSISAFAPVQAIHKAGLTWQYRCDHHDMNLLKGRFREITHSIFRISNRPSVLASSSFFPTAENPRDNKKPRIALNIIPISADETAFIFSYPKVQSANARKLIAPVMLKNGDDRLLALSTLTLDTAENLFLRPSHVDSWSDQKRATRQKAYFSTVKEVGFLGIPTRIHAFLAAGLHHRSDVLKRRILASGDRTIIVEYCRKNHNASEKSGAAR